jgi:hypothetical protein
MKTTAKLLVGMIIPLLVAAQTAQESDIIYSQSFTGSNSADLVGSTSTAGNGTWVGANFLSLAGTTTNESKTTLALPFTPESGKIYELKATINVTATRDDSYIGVFFVEDLDAYSFASNLGAWRRLTSWQSTVPQADGNQSAPITSNDILIRLDTTDAHWTASVFQGGIQMGNTFTYPTNPTINYVGFVSETLADGSVSNFELSALK